MPRVNETPNIINLLQRNLERSYPQSGDLLALAQAVFRHFGADDINVVNRALQMHVEDDRPDRGGRAIGREPPTIADLVGHIHTLTVQVQATREAQERRQESDAHYARALETPAWRAEIQRGADIKYALQGTYPHLEKKQFWPLLMGVLSRVEGETGLGTVEEALAVAPQVLHEKGILLSPIHQKEMEINHG